MTWPRAADGGERLIELFERAGCEHVDTPVLQPAETFLDLSGEDIRRRLFLTQDAGGREFCLRPEWTIPVCRAHIASGRAGGDYCYLGAVFRHREDQSGEFLQAGIELLGREDPDSADADALGFAVEGYAALRDDAFRVRLGDMALLEAVLRAVDVDPAAQRRLVRALAAGRSMDEALRTEPDAAGSDYSGLLSTIAGQDPRAARAFVEDIIRIAGVTRVGGRSAGEIAERFLAKAERGSRGALSERARHVVGRYLAIAGDLDETADALRGLARDEGLAIEPAIEHFEDRTGYVAARGIDLARLRFSAAFVRTLDYYTGMIFELSSEGHPDGPYLVAGGRYDRLVSQLGGAAPVPAVGCSFWLDRFEGAAS